MSFLSRLFRREPRSPKKGEIKKVDKTRKDLSSRRERLLYEAMELDDELQRLYKKYQEEDSELLKKELMRSLTIKRADYESLEARLAKLGESELAMTRRSAFLQSFLDLPEITDKDLDRLEELQDVRKERERRSVLYTDKVIGLTDMQSETSEQAESLQQRALDALEAEDRARQRKAEQKAAKEAAREKKEDMVRLEKAAREKLAEDDGAVVSEPAKAEEVLKEEEA
jgi:hypothetical protein